MAVFLHWLIGSVGITLGVHRLITHLHAVPLFIEEENRFGIDTPMNSIAELANLFTALDRPEHLSAGQCEVVKNLPALAFDKGDLAFDGRRRLTRIRRKIRSSKK